MAEFAVSLVIDKLGPLLAQEVNLLRGVHREVADIKADLEDIRAFLKDADSRAKKEGISEGVKVWVKQAREVAYQIEDVIDKYMLRVAQHHDRHGFVGFLRRIYSSVKKLQPYYKVASEIQDASKNVKKVKGRSEKFQLISSRQGPSSSNGARSIIFHDPRLSALSIKEIELVGIESPRDKLISLLVSETSKRKVISVVGLGGVGKTTVAKKVYENNVVKGHFEFRVWITVSQSYERKELMRRIIQKFCEEKNEDVSRNILTMDDSSLISKLQECFQVQRYLVVFDDVWHTGFWEDVKPFLLENENGSRILVTTRNEDVATSFRRSSLVDVFRMELLTHQQAWELFCKSAFKVDFEGKCPKNLEKLSKEIVRRCGGLPLAIVAIGGLLATKEKMGQEWEKFLNRLGSAFMVDQLLENVTKILSLSYGDLPFSLKSCFLFFGMFPEDVSVTRRRILQLWVAEGCVQEKLDMTVEEVAEEYLTELVNRNLVQVDEIGDEGNPKRYCVHDMVREVILSKSEELDFCHVSSNRSTFEGIARHLSITGGRSNCPKSSNKYQTRSIIISDKIELPMSLVSTIFEECKLLTTLDFEGCPIDHIPKEVGNLKHLRCLNLRYTVVSELPKSIGKLHNLESLDLRDSYVKELPVKINRFPKLRHLLGYSLLDIPLKIRGSIGHLECLQTLDTIRVDDEEMRLIRELGKLKQLRKLGIRVLKRNHGRDLCISIEKMTNLHSLDIFADGEDILEVESMTSSLPHLRTLKLRGRLERLPEWIFNLHNLSKLRLWKSSLVDDPIKLLQALPNLKSLMFSRGYKGERMHFEEGGFQKLRWLHLGRSNELKTIIIDKGAMPVLEELSIVYCFGLEEVPSGIQHLKGLKQLRFGYMPDDFIRRLSSDEGEDYWIVKHVPSLQYSYFS